MENKVYSNTIECRFCRSMECIHTKDCCFNISSKIDEIIYFPKNVYSSLIGCDTLPTTASFICQDYQVIDDEGLLRIIGIGITEHLHFCEKCGLNPDIDIVNNIQNGLLKKYKRFGNFYCPCKLQNIPENICPCKDHLKEIEANGICHCRLYVKKEI
jgi:hypothetical protein